MPDKKDLYDKDLKIVFEDDNVKIIKPITEEGLTHLQNYLDLGSLRSDMEIISDEGMFIVGKAPNDSIFLLKDSSNNTGTVVLDVTHGFKSATYITLKEVITSYPTTVKFINSIFKGSETYEYLKSIAKGETIPRFSDSVDFLISGIDYNENAPLSSTVEIMFADSDDFLDIFDIDDEDKYSYKEYNSHYSNREPNYWRYRDDWSEGFFINYAFNNDNTEKFNQIINIIAPELSSLPEETESDAIKVKKFDEYFSSEANDFVDEYAYEYSICMDDEIRKEINSDFNDPFKRFGIKEINKNYKYETKLSVLLTWYKQIDIRNGNLKDLLTKLIETYDRKSRGSWSELEYELQCDSFDYESYNKYVSDKLDGIIDSMSDDEQFINFDEHINYIAYIKGIGGFNKKIKLPKDKNKYFVVKSINPKDNKANIYIYSSESDTNPEERSLSKEEFNTFLYNYELFNENKLKLWTIIKDDF
jgi:CRISPR-associated DxTHG motif protein